MNELNNWLHKQKDKIDNCIKLSASKYVRNHSQYPNFSFDLNVCNSEALNLVNGHDLYYDRPGTALSYVLWYQGRRINMLLPYLTELIYNNKDEDKIDVFDLGAGTGAVQFSIGLIIKGFESIGIQAPLVRVINIDTSGIMLDYLKNYLWESFEEEFGPESNLIPLYSVNSWVNKTDLNLSNPWLISSYLFDSSDNFDDLKSDFRQIVNEVQPEKIILLSSLQRKKQEFLQQISQDLSTDYDMVWMQKKPIFSGMMSSVHSARQWIKSNCNVNYNTVPTWDERSFTGVLLTKKNSRLSLDFGNSIEDLHLYNPAIIVRRDVVLNYDQILAATDDGRPTVITGPAGCGKSIVITERVINIIKNALTRQKINDANILLTTFNKELKFYLLNWIKELLDREKIQYQNTHRYDVGITIQGSNIQNITLMHFDVLPTRIWRTIENESFPFNGYRLQFDAHHYEVIKKIINQIKIQENITTNEYDSVLEPTYIFDEYHRVIYGLQLWNKQEYLDGERKGRPRLQRNGIRRVLLWKVITEYLRYIENDKISSIYTRRHKFLKKIEEPNSPFKGLFSHVIVDEFQDCTQAEYKIFYGLLSDNNNLILAGDYAQAIHLGTSADIPRIDNDGERMRNIRKHQLIGSYRLPMNISKAIQPISQSLKDFSNQNVDIITPYKGAPPGIRPILVYANNDKEMAIKIIDIIDRYKSYKLIVDHQKVSIMEKDLELYNALNQVKHNIAETDTILRIKGMEKNVVLWSTRIEIPDKDEINNFVYTIMTRTSCLLIITICDSIIDEYWNIVKQIPESLRIVWDSETNHRLIDLNT